MKTKFLFFICTAVALLATTSLVSCGDDDDGDWDPMKWKNETKVSKEGVVNVPKSGGTYVLTCTNYDGFNLTHIVEKAYYPNDSTFYATSEGQSYTSITSRWATAHVSNNMLTVTIEPNILYTSSVSNSDAEVSRIIEVDVQSGDAFDQFYFQQQ